MSTVVKRIAIAAAFFAVVGAFGVLDKVIGSSSAPEVNQALIVAGAYKA